MKDKVTPNAKNIHINKKGELSNVSILDNVSQEYARQAFKILDKKLLEPPPSRTVYNSKKPSNNKSGWKLFLSRIGIH